MAFFDEKGIKYNIFNDYTIQTGINTDIAPGSDGVVLVHIIFDKNDTAHFETYRLMKINEQDRISAIRMCNDLANEYRWVSFRIDNNCSFILDLDSYLDPFNCGDISWKLVNRIVSASEDAYKRMKIFKDYRNY